MLAGALHLDLKKTEPVTLFLKRRTKRIVIPLIGWFLIYFLWVHFWRGQSINFGFIVKRIVLGGPFYHLYFLYLIGSLYLLTPILRFYIACADLFRKTKFIITFFAIGFLDSFFFYLLYHRAGWYDSISSFFPLFVFTFGFVGYFLAGYQLRIMTFSRKTFYFGLMGLLLSFVITSVGTYICMNHFGPFSFGPYLYDNFSPTCIVMSLCIFVVFKEEHLLKNLIGKNENVYKFVKTQLAPATFGIYLVHPIFLDIAAKFINITEFQKGSIFHLTPWLGIPFLSIIVVTLSFATMLLIQRIPYAKLIAGYW